jgi:hypothetical protein
MEERGLPFLIPCLNPREKEIIIIIIIIIITQWS